MARVKTFTNGGSLLPGDLNSIEDDYEFAFSTYKGTLLDGQQVVGAGNTAAGGPYILTPAGLLNVAPIAAAQTFAAAASLDPADWLASTRTTKLRVRAACIVSSTAPAVTLTVGLYPVTMVAGATTAGAVVAGSTVAFATPGTNTSTAATSGDFNAPAAAFFVLGFALSGTTAANSLVDLRAQLQVRQV